MNQDLYIFKFIFSSQKCPLISPKTGLSLFNANIPTFNNVFLVAQSQTCGGVCTKRGRQRDSRLAWLGEIRGFFAWAACNELTDRKGVDNRSKLKLNYTLLLLHYSLCNFFPYRMLSNNTLCGDMLWKMTVFLRNDMKYGNDLIWTGWKIEDRHKMFIQIMQ